MYQIARMLASFFVIALFITSCRTAQGFSERGDYDGAIDFCVEKLSGKKNKKKELVQGLELSFQKATERDMRQADALVAENRPENWTRIHAIHQLIQSRQEKVAPLLPLTSKDGYKAQFRFVNIEKLEAESRAKAAEYLYNRAENQLILARAGNKSAARDAFGILCDLENRYYRVYENKDAMKQEARQLGTIHIAFEVVNRSNKVLPSDFDERILAISQNDLNSEWKRYHLQKTPGVKMDYSVVLNLRQVDISPERIHERSYTDEREIEDGWEYVYDEKGNVKKDTNGNDIKHARLVLVRANVVEVFQSKAARLTGQFEIFDANTRARLDSREVSTEILFEHYASTFIGDRRALSSESLCRIGSQPVAFPQDAAMLVQAADRLKPELREELRNSSVLR